MELSRRTLAVSALTSACLLLFISSGVTGTLTEEQMAAIEAIIVNRFMGEQNVPGMSISVVQGDNFEQIYARGYGHSNIEQNLPATNETIFGVGSLSKMISSLFIVKLISDKHLELGEGVLDTPIRTLAPDYNLTFIDRYRSEHITFRDILSHKVCIATSADIMAGAGAFESKYDVVYRQRYCAETCGFRSTNWAYNNMLVHTAAELAAHIHGTGEEFEDLLVKFLRDEVGMKDIRTVRDDENLAGIPNMATAYYPRNGEMLPFNISLLRRAAKIPAAGGILVTATDMAHFMAVLGSYGVRMDGRRVVQDHVMRWMTRVSNPYVQAPFKSSEADRPRGDIGYGLGVIVGSSNGWERLRHVGYVAPFSGTMNVFPKLKLGIFTACSGPGPGPNHDMIHDLVFDLVQGFAKSDSAVEQKYEPWTFEDYMVPSPTQVFKDLAVQYGKPVSSVDAPTPQNSVRIDHSLLVGIYGLGVSGHFQISDVNSTTLYLKFGEFGTAFLYQRTDTPAIYDGELDSDLPHQWYSEYGGADLPAISVDFSVPLVAGVKVNDFVVPVIRGLTAATLPAQPWANDSC